MPFQSFAKKKTVDDYVEQYKYLSCSGIESRRADIDKKYIMASKPKKKQMKKQISALKKLKSANKCKK
ncbi:hypothetical protein [Photobacterium kagoshimensis]|uniref:hypothetical protein n=1 Tax=Photobacterium kagoshimensis TaxID=2910242 RepID=UPI003D10EB28